MLMNCPDGIITVVIAMYGIAFFPDTPEKTTAFYFTEQEKERAVERLVEDDREPKGEFSWNIFVRVVQSWQFYALSILWCFWNTTVGKVGNTVVSSPNPTNIRLLVSLADRGTNELYAQMQLYLKNDTEHTWSVYQINNIPTAINGWNIVMILFLNVYVDATGNRMTAVMINIVRDFLPPPPTTYSQLTRLYQFSLILGTALLTAWPLPLGARILSYLLASLDGPLSPLYLAWANILCSSDKQVRALTLACMNSFGAAVTTLIQQFLYPVTDAPEYRKGFPVSLACVCAMAGYVFVVRGLELREERRKSVEGVDVEEGVEGVGVRAEKVG